MPSYIDTKYVNLLSSRLLLFKRKNNGLYNFRCPFCGDSQKSKTKEEQTYSFGVIIVARAVHSQISSNNLMGKPIRNMLLKDIRKGLQEKVTIHLTQR